MGWKEDLAKWLISQDDAETPADDTADDGVAKDATVETTEPSDTADDGVAKDATSDDSVTMTQEEMDALIEQKVQAAVEATKPKTSAAAPPVRQAPTGMKAYEAMDVDTYVEMINKDPAKVDKILREALK